MDHASPRGSILHCSLLISLLKIGRREALAVVASCLGWVVAAHGQNASSLDASFNPGAGTSGSPAYVNALAVQDDGKIVIVGAFNATNGVARNGVARLNADGTLDPGFDPALNTGSYMSAVVIQADGKIVIGGNFNSVAGTARQGIARLNTDGSLDPNFDPGTGTDLPVLSLAVQSDGKIVLAGGFTTVNGVTRKNVARLGSNGSLDLGFDPGSGPDQPPGPDQPCVYSVALQSNGKLMLGGAFTTFNGVARAYACRLNADGSLDDSFNSGIGPDFYIYTVNVLNDGGILLGGAFSTVNGVAHHKLARYKADGTLDEGFTPDVGTGGAVQTIAVQADGKILIGGAFVSVNGAPHNRIARLAFDGSSDNGFATDVGADGVFTIAVQNDGKILFGGEFTAVNGATRNRVARLNGDPRGTLQFDTASYNAAESLGSVALLVTRKGGSAGAVSVDYATANGSAQAGSDYTATGGTLSWADGDTSTKSFTVPIVNDTTLEGNESFAIALSTPTGGASLGSPVQSVVTILDDDTASGSPGVVQFGEPNYSVAENAGTATITVKRLGGTAGAVSVGYISADGTAIVGADYQRVEGTLSWADGDSGPKTFTVPILDDAIYEGNETLNLSLRNATGGVVLGSPAQTALTIIDDDPPPASPAGTIAFSQNSYSVIENAGAVTITATRTDGSAGAVSISYATAAGSAAPGTRYQDVSGTLSWAGGDAVPKSFVVPILNDTVADGDQTVLLSLSAPVGGASLGSLTQAVLTIQDDGDSAPPPPSTDLIQAVNLLSPPTDITVLAGQTLDLYVSVEAAAGDFSKVEFFAGDTFLGFSTALRDRKTWMPATPGDYLLKAVATDRNGAQKTSANPIHVVLPQKNSTAPNTALLSGLNGRKFAAGSTVKLVASATDASGKLAKVQFYADDVPISTTSVKPELLHTADLIDHATGFSGSFYTAALKLGNQLRDVLVTAVSTNSKGITTVSSGVIIKSTSAGDKISCAITSPGATGKISAGSKATVSADRSGGAISRVEFFVNQTSIGAARKAPFTFTIPKQAAGQYALTAIATDTAGVSKTSSPVVVTFVDLPLVSAAAVSTTATVGGKLAAVVFSRKGGNVSRPVTVHYTIKTDAEAGIDFKMLSGEQIIPAGRTSTKLKIKALGDLGGAAQKTIELRVVSGAGYTVDRGAKPIKIKLLPAP